MSHSSQIKEHKSTPEKGLHFLIEDEESYNAAIYLHNFYEQLFNGKVGAPVHEKLQNGAKVLEFRYDGGVWVTEVAAEYPNSKFYSVHSIIPNSRDNINNITFIGCNSFTKLPFPDNEFDYVYAKDSLIFMGKNTLRGVLSEIFRILKPGGKSWLNAQNIDYGILENENLENYLYETGKIESISYRIIENRIRRDYAFGEFIFEIFLLYYRIQRHFLAPFMKISFEEFDNLVNNVESELDADDDGMEIRHKRVLVKKSSYTIPSTNEICTALTL
ncbi:7241_t:CDS:2 [Cetraspora pellucida]|uniref:7241_t:CDS:1 n=1 Tax=Cetraspora pellucida TaxID=1433469 RepID=A0A9N9EPE8_9GLOM|nr:7241_t:CDS:2 [Cetraspora pellucida]